MTDRTKKQLEDLRARLQQRREVLSQEIRDVRDQMAEGQERLAGIVRDTGDDAVADVQADVDHAMVARDIQEIRDVDGALKRIETGDFGTCIDCSAPIEPERLVAYPTAKRCFPCQVQREHTYARANTPNL
jgi:RNA polymerase-binding protein DksA